MKGTVFKSLDKISTDIVLKLSPSKVMATNAVIVYEGQIPNLAICIHEGTVHVGSQKFDFNSTDSAVIILLNQFNLGLCSNESVQVDEGSRISILDKSMVSELLASESLILKT